MYSGWRAPGFVDIPVNFLASHRAIKRLDCCPRNKTAIELHDQVHTSILLWVEGGPECFGK